MRLLPWKRDTYTAAERERILDDAARDQAAERRAAVKRLIAAHPGWGMSAPDHRNPQRSGQ